MHLMKIAGALFLFFSASALHAVDRGHGRVTVNGQLLMSACSIHTDDVWQEIVFDTLSPRILQDNPSQAEKKFSVRLQNCRLDKENGKEWNSLTVTFDGEHQTGDTSLFSVAGDAKGVALKIEDEQGNTAFPGITMDSIPLDENGNHLNYRLKLVPNGSEYEEGNWFGTIRFMVAYQ